MSDIPSRPARLQDVAARAGVSKGLVSRLLNNDASLTVREETRAAVMRAVHELDYVPNSTASALRRSRTDTIGLGLEHITNPLFRDIVHGAQASASEHGSALLLLETDELSLSPEPFDHLIKASRIDGLLLQGGFGVQDLSERYARRIPTVVVNSPGTPAASGVSLPDEDAARIATEHLASLGHRRIGFVGGALGASNDARLRGFIAGLTGAGLAFNPALAVTAGWEGRDGVAAIRQHLDANEGITGYVVASAIAALGVMHGLATAGLRVPDDVSLVTVHDPWFAELLNPPLTTVALPLYELGYVSMDTLMAQIKGAPARDVLISDPPPRLIVRGSSTPPAAR